MSSILRRLMGPEMLTLHTTGACGNINHWDVHSEDPQRSFAEAERIGTMLAGEVLKVTTFAQPVIVDRIEALIEERLEAAVRLDPRFGSAHHLLGLAYHRLGQSAEAGLELARGAGSQPRLLPDDLTGGTFTLTNTAQLLNRWHIQTPMITQPESTILGTSSTVEKPVVKDGEIVIRPMMYVALSYDHRIVDGKGAVTFLKRVKEFVENPERIMMEI